MGRRGAARAGPGRRGRGGASYPAGPAPKSKEPLRETFLQGWAHAVMPPGAQSPFQDSPRARLQAETRAGPVSHGLNLTDSLCDCGRASSPQRGRRSLLGNLGGDGGSFSDRILERSLTGSLSQTVRLPGRVCPKWIPFLTRTKEVSVTPGSA